MAEVAGALCVAATPRPLCRFRVTALTSIKRRSLEARPRKGGQHSYSCLDTRMAAVFPKEEALGLGTS